jgi:protocatechuate 3,4-dioxygenase beta subunit
MLFMAASLAVSCIGASREEAFRRFAKPLGGTEWSGAIEAPKNPTWKTRIDEPGERGDALIVSGTIFKRDGRTPAGGVLLYVYHTDANGEYSRGSGRGTGPRHGKLRGWMLTSSDGKYEFRTVRPAPYPGRSSPAHIHATLTADEFPEHWVADFLFKGDTLIPARVVEESRAEGQFAFILDPVKGSDGVWRTRRDIKLEPARG